MKATTEIASVTRVSRASHLRRIIGHLRASRSSACVVLYDAPPVARFAEDRTEQHLRMLLAGGNSQPRRARLINLKNLRDFNVSRIAAPSPARQRW